MNNSCISAIAIAALCGAASAHADADGSRSRADVVSELHAAQADGSLQAMNGEDSGSFWMSQHGQPLPPVREIANACDAPPQAGIDAGALAQTRRITMPSW